CSENSSPTGTDQQSTASHGTAFRRAPADSAKPAERPSARGGPAPEETASTASSSDDYTGSTKAGWARMANLTPPDEATAAKVALKPLDDKSPVGAPDSEKPDYLRVAFAELAAYDYDPMEAALPRDNKDKSAAHSPSAPHGDGAPDKPTKGLDWQIPDR